jgi:large subunit ribosomal protein L31
MKSDIHPEYQDASISCACGNVASLRSTNKQMHVDVCSKCHPFFTGKRQLLVDRGGRIEQFNKRYQLTAEAPPISAEEAGAQLDQA